MTNYIEEMMRTAGVEPMWMAREEIGEDRDGYPIWGKTKYFTTYKEACKYGYVPCDEEQDLSFPDFTPEKQLEIIKLIIDTQLTDFGIDMDYKQRIERKDFVQALAQLTTELMKSGELDKEKVKEVLKG